ncbi:MAG: pantetheine-phosphate adenylyltransferase [Phycisphaerales bacterium]|nr:pantetheine-phosphate adenylyltransferase [Phycisphaerales bacterium]
MTDPPCIHRAIYSGSFDPVTLGHLDVIERGRRMFDDLIVAIGRNIDKRELFPLRRRREMVERLVREMNDGDPLAGSVRVETYQGLTVDFARSVDASIILRGIRNISDLAYECQLAMTNRQVANIETVFIVTDQAFSYTSSSLIRQIAALGGDLDSLSAIVPTIVIEALKEMKAASGFAHLLEEHKD